MRLKEFFKPDWQKVIIGLIILILVVGAFFFVYKLTKPEPEIVAVPGPFTINPPTAENPLVFEDLRAEENEKKPFEAGFYNKDNQTFENVNLGIRKCLNEQGKSPGMPPKFIGPTSSTTEPGERTGFKYILDLNLSVNGNELKGYEPGKYNCTLIAYNAGENANVKPTEVKEENIYEKKQFWLEVRKN